MSSTEVPQASARSAGRAPDPAGTPGALAAILNWAADEIDAQAAAHNVTEPQMIDLTDHIRCFADQPTRGSIVPWPEGVMRPGGAPDDGAKVDPADDPDAGISEDHVDALPDADLAALVSMYGLRDLVDPLIVDLELDCRWDDWRTEAVRRALVKARGRGWDEALKPRSTEPATSA